MQTFVKVDSDSTTDPKGIILAPGFSKYVSGARVPVFGHSAHSALKCTSTTYLDVPGTYSSSYSPQKCRCRLEVTFASHHDKAFSLRMFDPANPTHGHRWEFEFIGGHASNSWWNFQVTDEFTAEFGEPWPRQNTLQIKSKDGSEIILGNVTLWITSLIP